MSTARTATILTHTEPETKKAADILFSRLGLTTAGAINIFLHQSVETGSIPFRIAVAEPDIPDLDTMSDDEVCDMLAHAHQQTLDGRVTPIDEAFRIVEEKHHVN